MYRFIVSKKYVELLRNIARSGQHDVLSISRETRMAYGHMSTVLSQFAKEGIVLKERANGGPGMKVDVSITAKGKALIGFFDLIEETMGDESSGNVIENKREVENGKNNE
jgi:predicted transcriptional regulator